MHCMRVYDTKLCRLYDCSASVQQRRSLDPASASNKRVVEYLATVSPELELSNGSLCKACLTNSRRLRPTSLAKPDPSAARVWLRVWFRQTSDLPCYGQICCERSLPSVCKARFRAGSIATSLRVLQSDPVRALSSGSYPAPFDKKSRSEHQTLFLARAERVWARD